MHYIAQDLKFGWLKVHGYDRLLTLHAEFARLYPPDFICGCGERIQPDLARLGSVRCLDCRDLAHDQLTH